MDRSSWVSVFGVLHRFIICFLACVWYPWPVYEIFCVQSFIECSNQRFFPCTALIYCLHEIGLGGSDLNTVGVQDKPVYSLNITVF